MIDKFSIDAVDAIGEIKDGATVLVAGSGSVGQADYLIDALIAQGARDLTLVANDGGVASNGIARLLEARRVRRLICTYPRRAGSTAFENLYDRGAIELEIVPQGTLAERLRAAGAGIPAFYTPTAHGTDLAAGRRVEMIGGVPCVLEHALHGDLALIEAWSGDRWGNLTYRQAGRNFNPVMAAAARWTVAQIHVVAELGTIDPETIVTPGVYVNRLVHLPTPSNAEVRDAWH